MPTSGSYFDSPTIVPPSTEIPEQEQSAVDSLRDMLFVDTSLGKFLTALGQNYRIRRPDLSPFDDDLYRRIIQAIACPGPKTLLSTLYFLLEAVFGSQGSLVTDGKRPWRVYEVNPNETIIEVPFDLLGTTNETASYLHGWSGVVLDGATTTVFQTKGNALAAADDLVGLGCSVLIDGAWEEQTISTATYDAVSDETEITVGSAYSNTPTAGALFFVTVPGDSTSSYRGDYISPIWYVTGEATSVGPDTFTDSGLSLTPDQYASYFLRLADGAIFYPILSHTSDTFTLGANGATPPAGFYAVVASPADADEQSDTATTPVHDDRVYLQGQGLLDIAKQYILEVLKAAGVVVRFEVV